MKLSQETLGIIENFAGINPNILFREGNILATIQEDRSIFAKAELAESFKQAFAIEDLPQFLSVLKMLEEPELEFNERFVKIKQGRRSVTYIYSNQDLIIKPKSVNVKEISVDYEFELTLADLKHVTKASRTLGCPDVAFVGSNEGTQIVVYEHKNKSKGDFKIDLDTEAKEDFEAIFSVSDVKKIIESSYTVQISKKGMSRFINKENPISYWIALNVDSQFPKEETESK